MIKTIFVEINFSSKNKVVQMIAVLGIARASADVGLTGPSFQRSSLTGDNGHVIFLYKPISRKKKEKKETTALM